jgi:hypothetical protein
MNEKNQAVYILLYINLEILNVFMKIFLSMI